MKTQIKQILLDLIYTPDAKPRFINDNWCGGDVDEKLKRINAAVEALHSMLPKQTDEDYKLQRAGEILSGYDTTDELQGMIDKIYEHANKGLGTDFIDYVDGVWAWEKVEMEFTCEQFIKYIEPVKS